MAWHRKSETREQYLARRRAEAKTPENRAKDRAYVARNLDKVRQHARESAFRVAYGISRSETDRLSASQGGLCAACGRPPLDGGHCSRLHVDHDHETGKIRGMLCNRCNTALGLLFEDPKSIKGLLTYLEKS